MEATTPIGSRRIMEVKPGRYSPAALPGMQRTAPGEEAEAVGDGRHLVIAHGVDRLAAVERFQRGEGVGIGVDAGRRS